MSIEQNKQIMHRMIEEIWNQGNLATADELFAPEHTSPSAPQLPPGSEGTKILAKMFREAMPDYHMNIDLLVADESQVVGRFTQSGTHSGGDLLGMKASGRKATWTEIGVLKIKDGKIVESWYEVDMLSMIQQLNGTKQ
jgi:predicted ester cyclase